MNVAERLSQLLSERKWIAFAGVGAACLLLLVTSFSLLTGGEETEGFVPFEVKQRTLAITVTERGNLESQEETAIRCKVENFGRGDRSGTQIIMIIPNGSEVKKLIQPDVSHKVQRPIKERKQTNRPTEPHQMFPTCNLPKRSNR